MIRLSHTITFNGDMWCLVFTVEQTDVVPKKCILTRDGNYVDICTLEDFKCESNLSKTDTITIKKHTFDEIETLLKIMISKISSLKDDYERFMLDLRDSSQTWLKP